MNLTPDTLTKLKGDMAELFGWIKSSHRCEALGRGLGFKTYAAARAASHKATCRVVIDGDAFTSYLRSKGVAADGSYADAFEDMVHSHCTSATEEPF